MPSVIRHLINENGQPFNTIELQTIHDNLDRLTDAERTIYRNNNAQAIAELPSLKTLIISGPGTGKSYLFLDRINYWYQQDAQAKVFVTSFVRKLVADLQNDIDGDDKLSDGQRSNITSSTLHKFARSIVEQNHGTSEWQFIPHFRIIGQFWKDVVWDDCLAFYPDFDRNDYAWKKFEAQLHNAVFERSDEWQNLKEIYFKLCKFYNAAGFADLILRAKDALMENRQLNGCNYFIIDEYQDFNSAEDTLINQLVNEPKGLLVVGDDEQVLYEKLKSGKPTLIRNLYQNHDYSNGMLPFCGRSSFHVTKLAEHFILQRREAECIEKIYLPIKTTDDNPKVQIIACATAPIAVDYIEKFVADNKTAIDERKRKLASEEEKDAFLLILTPAKEVNFYGESKEKIQDIVKEYQSENRYFSEDYYKILNYYSLANNPQNNFTFRKVLYYENIAKEKVFHLIKVAMQNNQSLCNLESEETRSIMGKCTKIKTILEAEGTIIEEKIESISQHITIVNKDRLKEDMARKSINREEVTMIEHKEEEEAELEEIEVKKMGAVELITIIGSKGLSAEHVIIIGFDNVNMNWITKNAFYVAITRARKSLHIVTALGSGGSNRPHNFLNNLPDRNIEFYKYTKSDHRKTSFPSRASFIKYFSSLNYTKGRKVISR